MIPQALTKQWKSTFGISSIPETDGKDQETGKDADNAETL